MSHRQELRNERVWAHHAPRIIHQRGSRKLAAVYDYLRAAINDLPRDQRAEAAETVAGEIVRLAQTFTDGEVRTREFAPRREHLGVLRAQARRARARGTA